MEIDDRGLADAVYALMMGEGSGQFFPGLNVLVKNEDLPGGLWYGLRAKERGVKNAFLAACPDPAGAKTLILAQVNRLETQRELCLKMFRYGLQLAPLLQPPPAEGPDEARKWNLFWSGGYGLSSEEEKEMSRSVMEEAASIVRVFDDAPEAPSGAGSGL